MNVFLATLGCRLNEAELTTWTRELRTRGHRAVADVNAAQVVVVNSCAVTAEAARKSRKLVSSLRRTNDAAPIVLTGCYASLEPERARELAGVDAVVDNCDKATLVDVLEALPIADERPTTLPMASPRENRTRAFIKVQDGCRNRCTFCIVTVARGEERSRTITDIVDEIAMLAASGVQEAVLTGVHLGGFGSDIGTNLNSLVRAILADTDIARLRLSSLEPWDLPSDFHQLWSDPRLAPHLHLPLQSGCDATLKRMARRCPTKRYQELVTRLRDEVSDLTITTDLIVGFPGETEAEWAQTLEFVRDIGFAHMHIFAFSAREGTAAARFPGAVSKELKRARSAEMHQLAKAMKREALERFVGSRRVVLWERDTSRNDEAEQLAGYTDNYLRVVMSPESAAAPGQAKLDNRLIEVRLDRIEGDVLVADARPSLAVLS